jgi:hypothetical protein
MNVHLEFQAWAAEMSGMYYAEMREKMEETRQLYELIKELTGLKGELKKAEGGAMGYAQKAAELQEFLDAHKDHPLYDELSLLIGPMIGHLLIWEGEWLAGPSDVAKFQQDRTTQLQGWQDQIQGLIDSYQKDEQLEQLLISDLHKKGLAAIDFASNAQRSEHATLSNIIANMRG